MWISPIHPSAHEVTTKNYDMVAVEAVVIGLMMPPSVQNWQLLTEQKYEVLVVHWYEVLVVFWYEVLVVQILETSPFYIELQEV